MAPPSSSHSFFPILLLSLFLLSPPPRQLQALPQSQCKIPPVIFNFGDSNSDTGGLAAGLGYNVNSPYGRTFFRRSTGRLSDGRLVVDFLCQSVNTSPRFQMAQALQLSVHPPSLDLYLLH